MSQTVAHLALRYLIRSTGTPEVSTNNVLHMLLSADEAMAAGFLRVLSQFGERDVQGCRIDRESFSTDPVTAKRSFRDFLLSRDGSPQAVVETKIDSSLTSEDQVTRYLDQLPNDGLLVLITRQPLLQGLMRQASQQLGITFALDAGIYQARRGEQHVLGLSWTRLLRNVLDSNGAPFDELLALDAAIEGIADFVPFSGSVQDAATGRVVSQVTEVAQELCTLLSERLDLANVKYDWVSRLRQRGWAMWIVFSIRGHEFWVGYDAEYWALIPGDPEHPESGFVSGAAPSPIWVNRYHNASWKVSPEEGARLNRLDRLGIALPLQVPLGVPQDAVVEALLSQAVQHIAKISEGLYADSTVVDSTGAPSVEENDPDDESGYLGG